MTTVGAGGPAAKGGKHLRACPVCKKPVGAGQRRQKTKAGAWAHARCMPTPKAVEGKSAKPARKAPSGSRSEAGNAAATGRGVAARFAGTCVGCGQGYPAQTLIEKVEQGWAHPACAQAMRARARILAGETYRGRKAPDWRRGSSPSSTRATR